MPRATARSAPSTPQPAPVLFDVVRLTEAVQGIDRAWPAGSFGAVVEIYDDGKAYEVEFSEPIADIATVLARQLTLA